VYQEIYGVNQTRFWKICVGV